ncbi:hypothetical protein D3C87_1688680 [compost metagenome]
MIRLLVSNACWWPVFQAHAQRQTTRSQHVFNLGKRFFTQVRRLKKLNLGTLYQITDIVDSFCLKAVSRADSQFQIVNRAQQDRIEFWFLFFNFWLTNIT